MPPKLANSAVKKSKGKLVIKNYLLEPYNLSWPPLGKGVNSFVLNELKRYFQKHPEFKKLKSAGKRKREQRTTVPIISEQSEELSILRKHIFIGVNIVTKKLERGELDLVLACKSARPDFVTHHLITLCATRGTACACITGLSESLSIEIGLKSALAIGFSLPAGDSEIKRLLDNIKLKLPPSVVHWIGDTLTSEKDKEESQSDDEESFVPTVDSENQPVQLPTRISINKSIANKKSGKSPRSKKSKA